MAEKKTESKKADGPVKAAIKAAEALKDAVDKCKSSTDEPTHPLVKFTWRYADAALRNLEQIASEKK